jgi:hypothetical protein
MISDSQYRRIYIDNQAGERKKMEVWMGGWRRHRAFGDVCEVNVMLSGAKHLLFLQSA